MLNFTVIPRRHPIVAASIYLAALAGGCKTTDTAQQAAPAEAQVRQQETAAPAPVAGPAAAVEPAVPADVAAIPADATKTASGLGYRALKPGQGRHPTAADRVQVHYTGWTTDGKRFDSSVVRGNPTTFGLGQVIAGWTEGLQLMREGETARLWIPGKMAYDNQPGRPQGMLVFDVELIKIQP